MIKTNRSETEIPKGWRRLRDGEIIKLGDKFHAHDGSFQPCSFSVGTHDDWGSLIVIRKLETEMKKRWIKFTGKPPKFTDPAEAEFEVKTFDGNVAKGCYWAEAKIEVGEYFGVNQTFHTEDDMPIAKSAISHYRRV